MSFRQTALAFAIAAAAAPSAFANSGATFVGGELGFKEHRVSGQITREQVRQEYLAFREHPVLPDGTVLLPGEAGYVSLNQGVFADVQPEGPHRHVLGNVKSSRTQAAPPTEAELRAYREQYRPS